MTTPDDMALWLYTSGSTGRPKAAVHLHKRPCHHTAVHYAREVLNLSADDVVFSAAKMFFAYGLGNSLTFPLYAGATAVVLADRPTPESVLRMLEAHRPTLFFGVPTLCQPACSDHGCGYGTPVVAAPVRFRGRGAA
ncbi:MAG: AMP-binding protein [Pseudomonadales bacterium]